MESKHPTLFAQNGGVEDQLKVIDDWAQSLSIIVSNYKNT
jgi:hypothetical protein